MELSDIKSGLIFVLSWDKESVLRIGRESKSKLLDIKSIKGFEIDYIYYSEGHNDFYEGGRWIFNRRASDRIYEKQHILNTFNSGDWILIKDMPRYKRYPHEFV